MGWGNRCLGLWSLRSKFGLTLSNRYHADGTHDGEMSRLGIRDRRMMNDPRDSQRENELIMGRRISIDIHKRKNEVRGKVYSKVLNEGK